MSDMQPITINGRPMALCWGSNSPLTQNGGYGSQTALIAPRLRDRLGIQVGVSAFYGQYSGKITWQGIDIYPCGFDPWGNDIHVANAHQMGADLLLTHQDVWVQKPHQLTANGMRWASWPPIDSEPIAPQIALRLKEAYQTIALSHFGQAQARAVGLDVPLVLQGIDTSIFCPGSRAEARGRLGWPQDAFYVGMVAHNRGYPNRKAYPQQLEAFGQFYQRHKDARLYIHAYGDPSQDPEAVPLMWHLERYGAEKAVEFVKPYDLNMGCSTEHMVDLYCAFDVLLCVSMSEGFGIPLIEAQACGTPVITGDWTAMAENCYAGWTVARADSEPWPMSPLECFWRLPHVGAIAEQLEFAYDELSNSELRDNLATLGRRMVVQRHDQDMLIDTQWRAVLTDLAQRIEAEPVPYHRHIWMPTGSMTTQGVISKCQVVDCPAELCLNGAKDVYPAGAPVVVDGITLGIEDDPNGGVKHAVASEITSVYHLHELTFQLGDVVIDVGAHVGVVSCYLAKKWPNITVYAIEPVPANHTRLVRNIQANGLINITPLCFAVTSCSDKVVSLAGDPIQNTGHYSAYDSGPTTIEAITISLPDLLRQEHIGHIALLKLDCEGAEYEILHSMGALLAQVDAVAMEVHENARLRAARGAGAQLVDFVCASVPWVRADVISIPDAEEVTDGISAD